MGIFDRLRGLFGAGTQAAAGPRIPEQRVPMAGYWTHVVGESFHQDAIWRLDGGRRARGEEVPFDALLVPDPENPHDSAAVAVVAAGIGLVGHLSRADAATFRPHADELRRRNAAGVVAAILIGQWGQDATDGSRIPPGVMIALDLEDPDPERFALVTKIKGDRAAAARVARDPLSAVADWSTRPRVALTRHGGGRPLALIGESGHQPVLTGLAAGLLVRGGGAFEALVVPIPAPADGAALLIAVAVEGWGLVGRLSRPDMERYRETAAALLHCGMVGACAALLHEERGGIGVKLDMAPAREALEVVRAAR